MLKETTLGLLRTVVVVVLDYTLITVITVML